MMRLLFAMSVASITLAQSPGRLAITTPSVPLAMQGTDYRVQLETQGGAQPFRWEMTGGRLPAGIVLDRKTGVLQGMPVSEGDFVFGVRVTDSSHPPQSATRSYSLKVTRPLVIEWIQSPGVRTGGIFGSVRVFNSTGLELDVTVIIVAVNEINKAFTLGYQKLPLRNGALSPEITFGTTLPHGAYAVHADAVGESAPRNTIVRARRQTLPLRIN